MMDDVRDEGLYLPLVKGAKVPGTSTPQRIASVEQGIPQIVVSAATGYALQEAVGIDNESCHRLLRVKIHFADFV